MGLSFIQSKSTDAPNGGIIGNGGPITRFFFWNNLNDPNPDQFGIYKNVGATSPVEVLKKSVYGQKVNRALANINITANPFKGFTANLISGLDYFNQSGTGFVPVGTTNEINGFATRTDVNSFQYNVDLNLSYKFNISENIESTSVFGVTTQYEGVEQITLNSNRLSPGFEVASAGTIISSADRRTELAVWGKFLQQTFGFGDRLFLTGAVRTDGSSVFGNNERVVFEKVCKI